MPAPLTDFQRRVYAILTDLADRGGISGLDVRPASLGNPGLADMLFELNREGLLVMVADHDQSSVRIVGERREVDVPVEDLAETLSSWR